ncbi:MAG: sigma-70 family RNA polymerase sigma factor [Ruminococcus sp.]|nr:sigma-70 family RNA polymerase sigma factor [Ruminococcus sp.]
MTNEELAIQIQAGNTQHYAELWQNVRWLMHKILHKKLSQLTLPNYLTAEDMEQELYFALCKAVQAYDDTKPYKFTSYLEYHIMNALRSALPRKPLQESSYNQTTGEDESTELVEFIVDDTAAEKLTAVELTDLQTQTRQAVAELPYNERKAITLYYFKNINYTKLAETFKTSPYKAKCIIDRGLYILSQNKAIQALYDEFERHYKHNENSYRLCAKDWRTSAEYQKTVTDIRERRNKGEYISYSTEKNIMYKAEKRYIREHKENLYETHFNFF